MMRVRLLLLLVLVLHAGLGAAATATTTFTVSGTVVPTCAISAAPLNFGAAIPNPINANIDVTSTVTATCSAGAPYTIAMSVGMGAGATYSGRRLTAGANGLTYNLYTDAGRTSIWGDGTGGSDLSRGSGTGVVPVRSS